MNTTVVLQQKQRHIMLALAIVSAFAGTAQAQTCNMFNGHTWCSDGQGHSYQSQTFGNRTNAWDNQGNSWTTNRFGNQTWTQHQHNGVDQ